MLTLALSAVVGMLAIANVVIYKNSELIKNGKQNIEKIEDKRTAFQKNDLPTMEKKQIQKTNYSNKYPSLIQLASESQGTHPLLAQKLSTLQSDINYLDKQMEGSLKRLEKIEMGLSLHGDINFEGIKAVVDENTVRKIANLEEFKRNAFLEIEALKQKVYEEKTEETPKPNTQNPELDEKIRNIAFNIRN
ncbi:MAG: hypothetical protein Q7S92_00230 [Candidatus Diapherotrites archaeon]|nr:hypothetical protein [Candidatus Diapherotrites archaeon]